MKSGTCLFTGKAIKDKTDAVGSRKQALCLSQNITIVLDSGRILATSLAWPPPQKCALETDTHNCYQYHMQKKKTKPQQQTG